ncbi:MAG TPA: glycosyltransferase family 4 protein [Polyangiaceae bacterium]|nr:glycosyltransferase family 4 protein [Polyangiaceae bacterium]
MPIGLFHPAFRGIGGAEVLVASWARHMKEVGVDARVVTLDFDEQRWRSSFSDIPLSVTARPSWLDWFSGQRRKFERAVPRIEAALSDCSAVLASNFPTNAMLGAANVRAKRVWYCHEPQRDYHFVATRPRLHEHVHSAPGGSSDVERSYVRRLAKYEQALRKRSFEEVVQFDLENTAKLAAVLANSEYCRDNVQRVYGRNDVSVVYPMVRFPARRARSRTGLDRSGLKILTHSRLDVAKNLDTVIRAFSNVLPELPRSELHVVGVGPHKAQLEKLALELGVAHTVRFHGYLSDAELDRVYDACDVFALLPVDEPFGLVFPEAAARGLLLVGPDHGGPLEILDGGRLGFTCDPFSPGAVAEAFRRIWRLTDAEVDARRVAADDACRARFSAGVIGPQILRALGTSN